VKKYPDITELLKNKEAHRRTLAALPFEKKIEIVFNKMKARSEFIKTGRVVSSPTEARIESVDNDDVTDE